MNLVRPFNGPDPLDIAQYVPCYCYGKIEFAIRNLLAPSWSDGMFFGGVRTMILLKRVYEAPSSADGARYLVERLWPRGVKKSSLQINAWLKEVVPSIELRKWFHHDPARWDEFRRRYFAELRDNPTSWRPILEAARNGNVTLIYSSHDPEHNNAVVLKDFLIQSLHTEKAG